MAPGRRRKMAGMMRDDVARDAMRKFGFTERVVNDTIKELLELYGGGVEAWRFIEDDSYSVLLSQCLENQEKQEKQVKQEEEQHEPVVQEQEQRVETDASSTTVIGTSSAASLADGHSPVEGWISEGDTDSEEDGRGGNAPAPAAAVDSDDEMIQLTPEPLCEELQELLRVVQARNKRKRV